MIIKKVFLKTIGSLLLAGGLLSPVEAQILTTYLPSSQVNPQNNSLLSPRAAAMGSAFVGTADDASALLVNPAGLGFLNRGEAALFSDFGWSDAFQETGLIQLPIHNAGSVAVAGSYLNYGTFEGRDTLGSLASSYSADWMAVQAGWGIELQKDFSLGVGLRDSWESIAGSTFSILTPDFGLLLKPFEGVRVGVDYAYGGWGPAGIPLVSTLRAGASWQGPLDPSVHLLAALGDTYQSDSLDYVQGGIEASFHSAYFLRAGYQSALSDNGTSGFSNFTFGAGLVVAGLQLDYAFLPSGDLGAVHQFSIAYPLDNAAPALLAPPAAKVSNDGPKPAGDYPAGDQLAVHFNIPADFLTQGETMEAQGHLTEALDLYQKAVDQDPQNSAAWWDLAKLYFKLKQKKNAVPCFEKVLLLKPDNQPLQEWLEKYKASKP